MRRTLTESSTSNKRIGLCGVTRSGGVLNSKFGDSSLIAPGTCQNWLHNRRIDEPRRASQASSRGSGAWLRISSGRIWPGSSRHDLQQRLALRRLALRHADHQQRRQTRGHHALAHLFDRVAKALEVPGDADTGRLQRAREQIAQGGRSFDDQDFGHERV
ncbi:MAG: hypothetical protein IPK27_07230 [Rhodanobacteraceae bacterium]|nr:hypothetical protein [Rhodanobacteraceae bacterium]